jgi:hydroxylaminobenzene mutase
MSIATSMSKTFNERIGRRLLQLGIVLFLLGLLTGFVVPLAANPRMALSSHLEGVLNGTFLLVLGVIWGRLQIGRVTGRVAFGLLAYGTFANWGTTLLAAIWGAGETMMPLAAAGYVGTSAQEMLIVFGLLSLSLAMVVVCPIVLWGLRAQAVAVGVEPRSAGGDRQRARPQEA